MVVDGSLRAKADFQGVGERIVTARNLLGRLGRVVNPYGEDTFVINLHVENAGPGPVVLLVGEARLDFSAPAWCSNPAPSMTTAGAGRPGRWRMPARAPIRPRPIPMCRRRLLERLVPAGEKVEGRLAFPVKPAQAEIELLLPYRSSEKKGALRFRWAL